MSDPAAEEQATTAALVGLGSDVRRRAEAQQLSPLAHPSMSGRQRRRRQRHRRQARLV